MHAPWKRAFWIIEGRTWQEEIAAGWERGIRILERMQIWGQRQNNHRRSNQ